MKREQFNSEDFVRSDPAHPYIRTLNNEAIAAEIARSGQVETGDTAVLFPGSYIARIDRVEANGFVLATQEGGGWATGHVAHCIKLED